MAKERETKLAQLVKARERKFFEFDVADIFGISGEAVPRVAIRAPIKDDEDAAVDGAHQYVDKRARTESAKVDPELLTDAKLMGLLRRVCYEAEADVAKDSVRCQVFGSLAWMRENMTSDEIAVINNLAREVRRKVSPLRTEIGYAEVEKLARACWLASDSDIPEAVLASCDREFLTQSFVLLAGLLAKAADWTDATTEDEPDDVSD